MFNTWVCHACMERPEPGGFKQLYVHNLTANHIVKTHELFANRAKEEIKCLRKFEREQNLIPVKVE